MTAPRTPPPDDLRGLVESATRGDAQALEVLLERFLPRLHAYVRLRAGRMVLGRESSSDLAQSVCREALQALDDFRWEGEAAFQAWLFTLARRKIARRYEAMRTRKREAGREVPLHAARGPDVSREELDLVDPYRALSSPSQKMIASELVERMESAFADMPEDYREVILLSRTLGLSRKQVAAEMGRTEASVRNLLARALAALAARVDVDGAEGS